MAKEVLYPEVYKDYLRRIKALRNCSSGNLTAQNVAVHPNGEVRYYDCKRPAMGVIYADDPEADPICYGFNFGDGYCVGMDIEDTLEMLRDAYKFSFKGTNQFDSEVFDSMWDLDDMRDPNGELDPDWFTYFLYEKFGTVIYYEPIAVENIAAARTCIPSQLVRWIDNYTSAGPDVVVKIPRNGAGENAARKICELEGNPKAQALVYNAQRLVDIREAPAKDLTEAAEQLDQLAKKCATVADEVRALAKALRAKAAGCYPKLPCMLVAYIHCNTDFTKKKRNNNRDLVYKYSDTTAAIDFELPLPIRDLTIKESKQIVDNAVKTFECREFLRVNKMQ